VVAINAPLTLPPCIRCTLPCPSVERCEVPVVQWMRKWAPKLRMRGRSDPSKPVVTPYTQRAGELLLAADGLRTREALGQGSGPIAARAAYLRRIFGPGLRLHENLLEVHPSATLARIVGPDLERKSRHGPTDGVWNTRKQILASLAEGLAFDYVWPEVVVRNTHVWGAVICAFTAFLWAHESWRGPADLASDPGDEHSHSRRTRLLGEAVRELGERWLEDGWIWIPPPAPSR
jgi:hypothetical protein